jgi:hypothetical protein
MCLLACILNVSAGVHLECVCWRASYETMVGIQHLYNSHVFVCCEIKRYYRMDVLNEYIMYVCMYVCMHTCTCICMYAYKYVEWYRLYKIRTSVCECESMCNLWSYDLPFVRACVCPCMHIQYCGPAVDMQLDSNFLRLSSKVAFIVAYVFGENEVKRRPFIVAYVCAVFLICIARNCRPATCTSYFSMFLCIIFATMSK